MSCAPFLIALSSSGKRHDSVSRESSVHSMISSSSPLMKSMMPIWSTPNSQRPTTNLPNANPNEAQLPTRQPNFQLPNSFSWNRDAESYRTGSSVAATHEKFADSLVLPVPFHFATWPNGQSGRVRSVVPFVTCHASMRFGAMPVLIHSSIAPPAIEVVGAGTALAVVHAGHHVELNRRADAGAALRRDDLLEEVDGVVRRDLRIRPAVIQQELPAAREERPQIRIGRAQRVVRIRGQREIEVGCRIELQRIPRRDPCAITYL